MSSVDEFDENWRKLNAIGKEIVKHKLAFPNATQADLGRLTDKSRQAIHLFLKDNPECQRCIDIIDEDIVSQIKSLYPRAVMAVLRGLKSKDDKLASSVGLRLLDKILNDCPGLIPDSNVEEILEVIKE